MLLVGGMVVEVPLTEAEGVDRLDCREECACWLEFGVGRCVAVGLRER